MTLLRFHLFFILLAIVGADLFGIWALWNWAESGGIWMLSAGIVSVLGGLGLIFYAVHVAKMLGNSGLQSGI